MDQAKTDWHIAGEELGGCMCAWGCPCQFDALPTHGRCEGFGAFQIQAGHFGTTPLDGVRFAWILSWPGPIHEGNGTRQVIIDAQTTEDQRAALLALLSGSQGGGAFEIFASVCPTELETIFAPITFESDRERRNGRLETALAISAS